MAFRDQYREQRKLGTCNLTDSEIDELAWSEAERSSERAISQHNASVGVMKRKSGEAQ